MLGGAPFGYRYVRKTPVSGAAYEVIAARGGAGGGDVPPLRRRRRLHRRPGPLAGRQGVPTRTGKHRWDRSVIWGMLRNPAYAGTAVFGKTQVIHEPPG